MPALGLVPEGDPNSERFSESYATNSPYLGRYARTSDDELIGSLLGSDSIIGNDQFSPSTVHRSYGTLPSRPRISAKTPPLAGSGIRRSLGHWGSLRRIRSNTSAIPYASPDLSIGRLSRPISTYDDPIPDIGTVEAHADAKINGIRVWYSSFTSIDWLHDTIKDSLRFSRLRRRNSLRGRLWLAFDKSLGWIIVTIVGFLTAVVAFLVVRTEQLLFDTKEGYCTSSWWKSKRSCCPHLDNEKISAIARDRLFNEMCPTWRTWADVLSRDRVVHEDGSLEYLSYTCIAVSVTCLLVVASQLSYLLCTDIPCNNILFAYPLPHRFDDFYDTQGVEHTSLSIPRLQFEEQKSTSRAKAQGHVLCGLSLLEIIHFLAN